MTNNDSFSRDSLMRARVGVYMVFLSLFVICHGAKKKEEERMESFDLLNQLRARGVVFSILEDEKLAYDAPAGVLTAVDLARLTEAKDELLAIIAPPRAPTVEELVAAWPDDFREAWPEYVEALRQGGHEEPEREAFETLQAGVDRFTMDQWTNKNGSSLGA